MISETGVKRKKQPICFLPVIIQIIVIILAAGCSYIPREPSPITVDEIGKEYSPEELLEDLDYLFTTLEEIHPDLFAFTSREKVYAEKAKVKESLTEPIDRQEFYRRTAPIVTMLGDGHTGLYFPFEEWTYYRDRGGKVFPLNIAIDQERITVEESYLTEEVEIPSGAEVLALNGIDSGTIRDSLLQYVSGERIRFRESRIRSGFARYLWGIYDFGDDFEVEILCPESGETAVYSLKGITADSLKPISSDHEQPYTFEILSGTTTGYMDFRSFRDLDRFQKFLKETFALISENGVKDLIIDVRRNLGGNSALGDVLLEYLSSEPFTQYKEIAIRISPQIINYYQSWKIIQEQSVGSTYRVKIDENIPGENELRFDGNVYLLISSDTYSSASGFSSAVKYYGIGTLIGEETGGLVKSFGDVYTFRLPNSRLSAGVSHKLFIKPVADENLKGGITPHHEVSQSAEDTAAGRDTVLEYTLKLIEGKNR